LVNTGKHLISSTRGAHVVGGGNLGRLADNLRRSGYESEKVDRVFVTHLHSDHIGGLTSKDEGAFPQRRGILSRKAEATFWLSPELAAKAPKDVQPFFWGCTSHCGPYIKAGKWHTFNPDETIRKVSSSLGCRVTLRDILATNFRHRTQNFVLGDTRHSQIVQLTILKLRWSLTSTNRCRAKRLQLLQTARPRGRHHRGSAHAVSFHGTLRGDTGTGYIWAPVVYTDKWTDR